MYFPAFSLPAVLQPGETAVIGLTVPPVRHHGGGQLRLRVQDGVMGIAPHLVGFVHVMVYDRELRRSARRLQDPLEGLLQRRAYGPAEDADQGVDGGEFRPAVCRQVGEYSAQSPGQFVLQLLDGLWRWGKGFWLGLFHTTLSDAVAYI